MSSIDLVAEEQVQVVVSVHNSVGQSHRASVNCSDRIERVLAVSPEIRLTSFVVHEMIVFR